MDIDPLPFSKKGCLQTVHTSMGVQRDPLLQMASDCGPLDSGLVSLRAMYHPCLATQDISSHTMRLSSLTHALTPTPAEEQAFFLENLFNLWNKIIYLSAYSICLCAL